MKPETKDFLKKMAILIPGATIRHICRQVEGRQ